MTNVIRQIHTVSSADRLFANDTRCRGGDKLTSRKLAGVPPSGFLHKPAKLAEEITFVIYPTRVFLITLCVLNGCHTLLEPLLHPL